MLDASRALHVRHTGTLGVDVADQCAQTLVVIVDLLERADTHWLEDDELTEYDECIQEAVELVNRVLELLPPEVPRGPRSLREIISESLSELSKCMPFCSSFFGHHLRREWPSLARYDDERFYRRFRFTKDHFAEMYHALQMPRELEIRAAPRTRAAERVSSETALLVLLEFMGSRMRLDELDEPSFVNHHASTISRTISAVSKWIIEQYRSCLQIPLVYMRTRTGTVRETAQFYAERIGRRLAPNAPVPVLLFFSFLDGKWVGTMRPSVGQAALYSGYRKGFGFAYQVATLACSFGCFPFAISNLPCDVMRCEVTRYRMRAGPLLSRRHAAHRRAVPTNK